MRKSKKLPVFFLDQGEFLGGAERFLLDFLTSLDDLDLEKINPTVIGAKSDAYREGIKNIKIIDYSYPSVRGGKIKKFFAIFKLLIAAWRLKNLFPYRGKFTVFSNSPRTHFVMYMVRVIFRKKGRWVCMLHDFTIPNFLLTRISRAADVLIANGEPMKLLLRDKIRVKDFEKIKEVSNGLDFQKIPLPRIPNGLRKVLVLGRIDPRKGQIYALQAADILHKKYVDIEVSFVGSPVEGDTRTQEYAKKLREYRRINKVEDIKFLPEVRDPFKVIQDSDLVLFLPTEPETFGRVVIESMALGKLIIAFNETGPREILNAFEQSLRNVHHSLLVPPKNAQGLADRIQFFYEHFFEAQKFMEKSRKFVEKRYNLKETKQRLMIILGVKK